MLEGLGFNLEHLGSHSYVVRKLRELSPKDEKAIRTALIKYKHRRFFKVFVGGMPYGDTKLYDEKVRNASVEQLATLIKTCGFLLQTKVYLFWQKP
jgi:rRNA pseudouridine-1189 N-methylase Emg1 (Nep1/Mra1 family)